MNEQRNAPRRTVTSGWTPSRAHHEQSIVQTRRGTLSQKMLLHTHIAESTYEATVSVESSSGRHVTSSPPPAPSPPPLSGAALALSAKMTGWTSSGSEAEITARHRHNGTVHTLACEASAASCTTSPAPGRSGAAARCSRSITAALSFVVMLAKTWLRGASCVNSVRRNKVTGVP
jgi:hypothetical protein